MTLGEKLKKAGKDKKKRHDIISPHYIYNYFGDFSKITVIAKYAGRVGLLLSPTCMTIFVKDSEWKVERDIREYIIVAKVHNV